MLPLLLLLLSLLELIAFSLRVYRSKERCLLPVEGAATSTLEFLSV